MKELRIQGKTVPLNFGPLRGANGNARLTGPCGDTMEFWVRIDEWRIAQATYTTDGCGSSIISGFAAALLAEGATVDQALDLRQEEVLDMLGGLPEETRHCALLAANTLKAAIHDYLKRMRQSLLHQPETRTMRIAVPIANGVLCQHFGHCEQFAIVDVKEETKDVLGCREMSPPAHAPGVLPAWLAEQKVNLVIAGGMGGRAQQLLGDAGLKVLIGAPSATPEQLVSDYLAGKLVCGQNVCDH